MKATAISQRAQDFVQSQEFRLDFEHSQESQRIFQPRESKRQPALQEEQAKF